MTTDALSQHFISPDPDQAIELLLENQPSNVLENRTLVYTISNLRDLDAVVTALGSLADFFSRLRYIDGVRPSGQSFATVKTLAGVFTM